MDEKKKVVKVNVAKSSDSKIPQKSASLIDTEQLKKQIASKDTTANSDNTFATNFVLVDESDNITEEKPSTKVELIPQLTCPRCGASVNNESAFCPKCGQAINQPIICSKCGRELSEDAQFCPSCGTPKSSITAQSKYLDFYFKTINYLKKTKFVPLIIALLAIGLIIFLVVRPSSDSHTDSNDTSVVYDDSDLADYYSSGSSKELYNAYNSIGGSSLGYGVSLSSDQKSITIDTKPNDIGADDENALKAIILLNSYLDLPDSLIERMDSTRAIDGTQTATYDDISITWNYHPDNGLKVIYELTR